jgi:mono/diheme cytochrome c family protein
MRLSLLLLLLLCCLTPLAAQQPADDYRQNCISCHTIGGGRLTGPDLKDVTKRKDRAWLTKFIIDPKAMFDAGDPYALKILQESRNIPMPTLPGMTKARAEALLDLIEEESKKEKSVFAGVQLSDRPFTDADVQTGHTMFIGTRALKHGGPSCISCHTVQGLGGFGGGTLAPDLTTVFERYQGRKTLSAWLSAPATPTMQSLFKQHPLEAEEILSLVAYFQHTLQRNPQDVSTTRLNFILIGLAGTLVVLGLFDVVWNKRLRSVRRRLVQERQLENPS